MIPIIVQARRGSTRLPGKINLPWGETTLLSHVLHPLVTGPNPVTLARPEYHPRIAEADVLSRFIACIGDLTPQPTAIFRVCADRPFIVPELIEAMIRYWEHHPGHPALDYLAPNPDAIPFAGEILSLRALHTLDEYLVPSSGWREHCGVPYIALHPERFETEVFPVTVDTEADYNKLRP